MSLCGTLEGLDGKCMSYFTLQKWTGTSQVRVKKLLSWLLRKARADLDPRLGPARRGPPRPRGAQHSVVPGEVLAARIVSARTPVPYPRMKTGSRGDQLPDGAIDLLQRLTRRRRLKLD